MNIQVSAIICTHNRTNYLRKSLQSLVEQNLASELYEIIVVDNHSTDNTQYLVKDEFNHVTNLVYIYEPRLGLSPARNIGWQVAKGEYVAFLDDDAIAFPCWLENILKTFQDLSPQLGGVGGKVEPIWEATKPDWLPPQFLPYLTVIDWSDVPIILDDDKYIGGANMAFPKSLLEATGGFEFHLGRKGSNLMSNDELLLCDRIKEKGYYICYDPKIVVRHHIHPSRLTKNWFQKRYYYQGVSDAFVLIYQESLSPQQRSYLLLKKLQEMLKSPKQFAYLVLSASNPNRLRLKCNAWKEIGYIWGLIRNNLHSVG